MQGNGAMFGISPEMMPAINQGLNDFGAIGAKDMAAKQYGLNTDPLKDIEPYRVNPYKGFLAKNGGVAMGNVNGIDLNQFMAFVLPAMGLMPMGNNMKKGGAVKGGKDPDPIYVTDPNDPRLRAYQDSLSTYNEVIRYNNELQRIINFGHDYKEELSDRERYPNSKTKEEFNNSKRLLNAERIKNPVLKGDNFSTFNRPAYVDWRGNLEGKLGNGFSVKYFFDSEKPVQPVELIKRDKVNINELPSLSINELSAERPLPTIDVEHPDYTKERATRDWTNVPGLKVIYAKSKESGKMEPVGIQNREGKTIEWDKYKDKPLPKGFQYPTKTNEMKHGGPIHNNIDKAKLGALVSLLHSLNPGELQPEEHMDRGGRIQRRQEKLNERLQRLQAKGKTGGNRYENIQMRLADIQAGGSGLTNFGRGLEDSANMIGDLAGKAGMLASIIPGVGIGAGLGLTTGGKLLDKAVTTDAERGVGLYGNPEAMKAYLQNKQGQTPTASGQPPMFTAQGNSGVNPYISGSLFNQLQVPGGLGQPMQQGQQGLGALTQMLQGQNPSASGGGINPYAPGGNLTAQFMGQGQQQPNPLQGLMGMMGGQGGGNAMGLMSLLQGLMPMLQGQAPQGKYGGMVKKKKKYALGGEVSENENEQQPPQLIPIQAEKIGKIPEMIIHLDSTITPVNATKKHSQMDDDEVTDIVPEGSYIASADKSMRISWKEADDIVIAIKQMPYKELEKGKVPEEIRLSSLWPTGNKKDYTPAELTQMILDKYPTVDRNDIFTKVTNQSNLKSRLPYIMNIIKLSEQQRANKEESGDNDEGIVGTFKKGGQVRVKNVHQVHMGDWIGLAGSLAPLLGNLLGGNKTPPVGGISPFVQNGMLATLPAYQLGVNQNVAAQQGALGQGIDDFSALGQKLIGDARQSFKGQSLANLAGTGLSAMNALAMETNLPRLDLSASRARVNNFRPSSGTRASIEAAATPTYDAQAIMDTLGSRSGSALAQLNSQQMGVRNQAAQQRNQFLDATEQNRIGQLNQLDATELPFNIQQQEKERSLREAQRNQLTGSFGQGIQRGADLQSGLLGQEGQIQSQILPITTQFNLQRAQLEGQPLMLGAQNTFNGLGVLGSMQGNAALTQALQQQNQSSTTPPGQAPPPPGMTYDKDGRLVPIVPDPSAPPGSTVNTGGGTTEQFGNMINNAAGQLPNLQLLMQLLGQGATH